MNSLALKHSNLFSFVFVMLALASFSPSIVIIIVALLMFGFIFYKAALKYLLFCCSLTVLAMLSMLIQQDFYFKGLLISFFFFLPFMILMLDLNKKAVKNGIVMFMKAHIILSLIQIPIQFVQFIMVFGLDLSLIITNSSAGDVGGTLGHSFVLAEKQVLSIFFLIALRKHFKPSFFKISVAVLSLSFLFIGANTSTLILLLSVLIYYLFLSNVGANFLKKIGKNIALGSGLVLAVLLINSFVFTSQSAHISNLLSKASDNIQLVGKVRLSDAAYEVFSDDPSYLLFGLGVGHFSSRVSFILSGEYLTRGVHPLLGVESSDKFNQLLRPLWNDSFRFNVYSNNTLFQPFSSIITLLSEYGILVFIISIFIATRLYRKITVPIGKVFIIMAVGMMFVDNILEYPRIVLPALFFVVYLLGLSRQKKQGLYAPNALASHADRF